MRASPHSAKSRVLVIEGALQEEKKIGALRLCCLLLAPDYYVCELCGGLVTQEAYVRELTR